MQLPLYMYVFIRQDLPIEQQIVQASHASHEAGREFKYPADQISNLILLNVKSEEHLKEIANDLDELRIQYKMFFEPDYNRGYTSIATAPISSLDHRRYFHTHKLYRYRPSHAFSQSDEFIFQKEKTNE